jgi:hypothetical protein
MELKIFLLVVTFRIIFNDTYNQPTCKFQFSSLYTFFQIGLSKLQRLTLIPLGDEMKSNIQVECCLHKPLNLHHLLLDGC